jgi:3-phenylpropionate/trans-cinnamate dioxygenase ferredoxin reductase subunit
VTTAAAAQSIREHDKESPIVIVCGEPHPPYDRPPLSKQFLLDDGWKTDDPYSKADDFYPENRIEVRTGVRVTAIDRASQTATLDNGETFGYEKLLLATGSTPRRPDLPGMDLGNVFLLRTIEDAEAIRGALRAARHGVCVGAGYIGMEVASAATQRAVRMSVVEPERRVWPRFASPRVGDFLQRTFEERGVTFFLGEQVTEIRGENGVVTGVQTGAGRTIPAEFVVVGVGVTLNTQLARAAGLEVDEKDGVVVDAFLRTSDPAIHAAGDIACFQDLALDKRWHAEHHLNAKWQGQAVGRILAGGQEPYDRVPYFFSDVFDLICACAASLGRSTAAARSRSATWTAASSPNSATTARGGCAAF